MRLFLVVACLLATPALAAPPVQTVFAGQGAADAAGTIPIELVALNAGDATTFAVAAAVSAELAHDGTREAVLLERAPDQAAAVPIAAGGFARLRYVLRAGPGGPATLALPGLGIAATPIVLAGASPAAAPVAAGVPSWDNGDSGNAFAGDLSAYRPMYAVYGPGSETDARVQFSLKYRFLGGDAGRADGQGLYLGYTQRIFADLGAKSNPFRDVGYSPEIFYLMGDRAIGEGIAIGGQGGVLHESNGRGGDDSRSYNTIYIQPVATFRMGDWTIRAGPRLWAFVGGRKDNPRIQHYRGNTGLFFQIGEDDGLRLNTNSRFNPSSGKGAVDAELSYPLTRLVGDLNLYLFGQAFTGYGENLLDYDRHQNRLRFGFGIVR